MIVLQNVSKIYNDRVPVLNSVSLSINQGDFLYVVGGTGAGKSTLLRLISTEERVTSGVLSLFGYDLAKVGTSTMRSIRQAIGYIPQSSKLIPDLTVYDNIEMAWKLGTRSVLRGKSKKDVLEIIEKLGLENKRNTACNQLSGGEAQRVAAGRALIRSPQILIADEPTGAQDRNRTWQLMELFVRANISGAGILVATHDREIVRRVQKKCAVLQNGSLELREDVCFL